MARCNRHKGTQRDTEGHRGTQRDTEGQTFKTLDRVSRKEREINRNNLNTTTYPLRQLLHDPHSRVAHLHHCQGIRLTHRLTPRDRHARDALALCGLTHCGAAGGRHGLQGLGREAEDVAGGLRGGFGDGRHRQVFCSPATAAVTATVAVAVTAVIVAVVVVVVAVVGPRGPSRTAFLGHTEGVVVVVPAPLSVPVLPLLLVRFIPRARACWMVRTTATATTAAAAATATAARCGRLLVACCPNVVGVDFVPHVHVGCSSSGTRRTMLCRCVLLRCW